VKAWQVTALAGGVPNLPGARNLYLPRYIDLINEEPVSIYWLGLAHLRAIGGYTFETQGPGTSDGTHWTWTPSEVGNRKLTVRAYLAGALVGRFSTTLRVRAATGHAGALRLNFNGDSITASNSVGCWPNRVTRLLTAAGFTWTTHGSLVNTNADANVKVQGHPGRTFGYFNGDVADDTRATTLTDATNLLTYVGDVTNLTRVRFGSAVGGLSTSTDYWVVRQSSTTCNVATTLANAVAGTPVVNITADGAGPTMYVDQTPYKAGGASYVSVYGAGTPFTDIVNALGVNDFGSCREDHPEDFAAVITASNSLVSKQRDGSPNARIYIVTQYNCSSEDDDFGTPGTAEAAQYDLRRLTAEPYMYEAFAGREDEGIYLVGANASCDPVSDFDDNNVHPNDNGHQRVGRLIAGSIVALAG
jgi:hypothetical protein